MRLVGLFSVLLAFSGCAKVETVSGNVAPQILITPLPTIRPASTPISPLKPVSPNVKLNAKQHKYLNDTLPPDIRKMLEESETLELLAEVGSKETSETGLQEFRPNRIVMISDANEKRQVLELFYSDAATQDGPASCYEPHHGLRFSVSGKTLEIEICFDCAQFRGLGDLQSVSGTIVRDGRKSERLFNTLIKNRSIEFKQ